MNDYISTAALYSPSESYLAHHGIKGQKWGIRRYQNEDGSYTSAGRKRYGMDLDINDKSRTNIARIRKGEAYRRLDASRQKNPSNTYRQGELQQRVRAAKKAEKLGAKIDKGSELAAKGRTVTGNKTRVFYAAAATYLASNILAAHLNSRLSDLSRSGRLTAKHNEVAHFINAAANTVMLGGLYAYSAKQYSNSQALRAYNSSRYSGTGSINSIGSQEYKDVVARRGKN